MPINRNLTFEEIDQFVQEADRIRLSSHADANSFLISRSMICPTDYPINPITSEYVEWVEKIYLRIAGVQNYDVAFERTDNLNIVNYIDNPYPYNSGDIDFIASYNMGFYHLIQHMHDLPGNNVLEYGPGWGHLALALLQTGFSVTCVDIESKFLELLKVRAKRINHVDHLCTHTGNFGEFPDDFSTYDAILFFECFHHWLHHVEGLKNIVSRLNVNGCIYLAAEAVYDDFPIPWGVRLDGQAIWATRSFKWCELGFNTDYLILLTRSLGLSLERYLCTPAKAFGTLYVARKLEQIPFGRTLLTKNEGHGFYDGEADNKIHTRFTKGNAIIEIPPSLIGKYRHLSIEFKNWLPTPMRVIVSGVISNTFTLQASESMYCRSTIDPYGGNVLVASDTFIPSELGTGTDSRCLGVAIGYVSLEE